ncbi:hypothetical protein JCM11641_003819 [Rhodosporidiobolus odoratus]
MAANAEQERTELLHEIARLEAEIAKVSRASAADSSHLTSPAGGSHKRPRRAANATEDGDETAGGWRTRLDTVGGAFCTQESGQADFKRSAEKQQEHSRWARKLVKDNAELTGIDFSTTKTEVIHQDSGKSLSLPQT